MLSLLNIIEKLNVTPDFHVLGDFNLGKISWNGLASFNLDKPSQLFKDYIDEHNFTQLVNFPTHKHGSTLDLILTSQKQNIIRVVRNDYFTTTCDHNMIEFEMNLDFIKKVRIQPMRNFYRGDFDRINDYLAGVDWCSLFHNTDDINVAYSRFTTIIHKSIEKFVPLSKHNTKPSLPKSIRDLIKQKKILYRKTKTDPTAKVQYKELDKVYKSAVKNFNTEFEKKILKNNNKKSFFGYINKKLRSRSQIPPLVNDDEVVIDPFEKAQLFNSYFSSVFTKDDGKLPTQIPYQHINFKNPMNPVVITTFEVIKSIANLKNSVSRTPDKIPSIFFKNACSTIAVPLTELFNLSIQKGQVPNM